jgi:hypothetical protein
VIFACGITLRSVVADTAAISAKCPQSGATKT